MFLLVSDCVFLLKHVAVCAMFILLGLAWPGRAWLGLVRGWAGLGLARRGVARQGKAWLGKEQGANRVA